jgi:hypothetical protein
MEARKEHGLLLGLGALLVLAFAGASRLVEAVRTTRVLTHIRLDGWARRHGW